MVSALVMLETYYNTNLNLQDKISINEYLIYVVSGNFPTSR